MINSEYQSFGTVSSVRVPASARAPARVVHCVCACQWRRVVLQKGPEVCSTQEDGQGQSCIPGPSLSPSLPHPYAVMGCLRGWWFPWQPAAFCAPRVMRAVCWRLRGGGGGVQSDIGWLRELREQGKQLSAIIQSASVLVSHPSL